MVMGMHNARKNMLSHMHDAITNFQMPKFHQRHLLMEDITRQRSTHQLTQPSTHQRHLLMEDITRQRSTHRPTQPSTHQRHLLMEDITSQLANASTPSMGNPMHTGD